MTSCNRWFNWQQPEVQGWPAAAGKGRRAGREAGHARPAVNAAPLPDPFVPTRELNAPVRRAAEGAR